MSKTKPKKIVKTDERLDGGKTKEQGEEKGDKRDAGEVKPPPVLSQWSDWIWDEALKLYYRARHEKGDDWAYEYAYPEIHPATKKEKSSYIAEKVEYPKVEQKIIFTEPEYKFEVPNTRGSEYLVSVREVMRVGMTGDAGKSTSGGSGKSGAQAAVKVDAGGSDAVKSEGEGKAGVGKEGKQKSGPNLEKSVDNEASRGAVKKQPEKEGKKKDREKRHERRDSSHREKERRK